MLDIDRIIRQASTSRLAVAVNPTAVDVYVDGHVARIADDGVEVLRDGATEYRVLMSHLAPDLADELAATRASWAGATRETRHSLYRRP